MALTDLQHYCELASERRTILDQFLALGDSVSTTETEAFVNSDLDLLAAQIDQAAPGVRDTLVKLKAQRLEARDVLISTGYDLAAALPLIAEMNGDGRYDGIEGSVLAYDAFNCGFMD